MLIIIDVFYSTVLQIILITIDNHSQTQYVSVMIHCICNNINTAKIDHAHACGVRRARGVQEACGSNFNCGQCKVDIQARLDLLTAIEAPVLQAAE